MPHRKLTQVMLFNGLSLDELKDCLKYVTLTQHERGEYIFHVGDPAAHVFMLLEGVVKVSYIQEAGAEKVISIFQQGDLFGELFLGKYRCRIGTARTLESSTLARVTEANLLALIGRYPSISINLIRHLADSQRETLARLHTLMHVGARHRLLGTLLNLARHPCCSAGDWFELPPSITQEDIASIACLNRSTVNVLINELRAQGVLGGKGRRLNINRSAIEALLRESGLEILE